MNTTNPANFIQQRSFDYAKRANRLYRALCKSKDDAAKIIGKQYLRSATSIGANIQEGCSAESRADFIHKYTIAQKEARESQYWINLIRDSELVPLHLIEPLCKETDEIISIITASIKTAKKNAPQKGKN